jgi:ABC-type multidrug transport system ATPase subunit
MNRVRSPDNTQQTTVPTLEISTNTDHEKHTYPLTQAVIDIGRDPSNTIDALDLIKKGNKQVILLNDISLVIPPRKFVALVGGSGAGKSTLMDALNGLRPAQQGLVFYNGQDYYRHLAAFSTQLGYVPQDDIIHRDLSVERALHYAAKLRLPDDFSNEQIKQRIDEVLADVDMKKQRNLLVSRLSGGQRKRVSIALELLANPSVFFLDEPTSGLDPGLDRKMMSLMRKLADGGRTIVLVTHATNNINACDYVCFLSRGGNLAYFGPPNEAKTYFGKTDFAEIYTALEPTDENPNIPSDAAVRFKQSPDYARYVSGPLEAGLAGRASAQMPTAIAKPPQRGNPWRQFSILAVRYLELLKNDGGNLAILLLQAPIIGLVLFFLTSSGTFGPHSIVDCPTTQDILANTGPIVSKERNPLD